MQKGRGEDRAKKVKPRDKSVIPVTSVATLANEERQPAAKSSIRLVFFRVANTRPTRGKPLSAICRNVIT
jgi:hypothetical protein